MSNSSNGPLMSECPSLQWVLSATARVPRVQQLQPSADVRVPIAAVGASSNHACATCPTVVMIRDVRLPVIDVGARSNRACATCPTVAMGEAHPLLLGHHSSDRTAAVGHLPIAIEGYKPLLQRYIVVVAASGI
jgi:hypothetical protein